LSVNDAAAPERGQVVLNQKGGHSLYEIISAGRQNYSTSSAAR
jgi:hypothetical protein